MNVTDLLNNPKFLALTPEKRAAYYDALDPRSKQVFETAIKEHPISNERLDQRMANIPLPGQMWPEGGDPEAEAIPGPITDALTGVVFPFPKGAAAKLAHIPVGAAARLAQSAGITAGAGLGSAVDENFGMPSIAGTPIPVGALLGGAIGGVAASRPFVKAIRAKAIAELMQKEKIERLVAPTRIERDLPVPKPIKGPQPPIIEVPKKDKNIAKVQKEVSNKIKTINKKIEKTNKTRVRTALGTVNPESSVPKTPAIPVKRSPIADIDRDAKNMEELQIANDRFRDYLGD